MKYIIVFIVIFMAYSCHHTRRFKDFDDNGNIEFKTTSKTLRNSIKRKNISYYPNGNVRRITKEIASVGFAKLIKQRKFVEYDENKKIIKKGLLLVSENGDIEKNYIINYNSDMVADTLFLKSVVDFLNN